MSKIVETKINKWNGGVSNDPRDPSENTCRIVSNYDILTNPKKMTPVRSTENGNTDGTAINIQNFQVALQSGTTHYLYALGKGPSSNIPHIVRKALTQAGVPDLTDGTWTDQATGSGAPNFNLFIYYRKVGLIYGAQAGTNLYAFDPNAVNVTNSAFTIAYTNIAQGLVHSKDDILYIPIDNKIYRKNGSNDFELALTLPTHFYITSICEYGNSIAIGIAPLSGQASGQSRVFLWDRDTSLTTLSETIPWEEGVLQVLDVIDGYLIGISITGNTASRFNQKILFRYLSGSQVEGYRAEKLFEIQSTSTSVNAQLPIAKQTQDGRLFFLMSLTIGGSVREGLWSLGRVGDKFVLVHENTPQNATATTSGTMRGFFLVGDFRFIAYDESGTYSLRKTSETAAYTTSIWEKRFATESSATVKRLLGVSVSVEPITTTTDEFYLNLYCKVDEESSFKRIFRHTGDNNKLVSHSAISIEGYEKTVTMTVASPCVVSLTAHALVAGQRIKFSTTGALPTGVTAGVVYFVISTGLTADVFRFSATKNGSAVNTSGSQSGTHTLSRADFFPEYKEIEFRIESVNGSQAVEITELSFKEEIIEKRAY